MNQPTETGSAFTPRTGEEGPGAPRLSLLSVAALLAGLLSAMAMVSTLLWPVAGAALVFCVLVKINLSHQRGVVTGEGVATVGLALALMFVTAAPTHYALRQWKIREQSAEIGREWLQFLVGGQPEPYSAYESLRPVAIRRPLSSQLELQYASDINDAQGYSYFLNNPLIKALGMLPRSVPVKVEPKPADPNESVEPGNPKEAHEPIEKEPGGAPEIIMMPRPIQVRHYKTEQVDVNQDGDDVIRDVFAVTWRDVQDQPHSMLVRLEIERKTEHGVVAGLWRIKSYDLVKAKQG